MLNLFYRKLEQFVHLTAADRQALDTRIQRIERIEPHKDLIHEGNHPRYVNVVLEGWACRYKQLEDGRRQILSVFVPGDMCDPCVFYLKQMSHSLGTLTPVTLARISHQEMMEMIGQVPVLNKAFWLDMMVSAEVQREWTVSLGRRTATERLAHFFCEISYRLRNVGLTNGYEYELPLTQTELGDALGLSSVHVNRTLQELRATGYVELKGKRLTIKDEPGLSALGLFDAGYLHFQDKV